MYSEESIILRPTILADLEMLFHFQLDQEANYIAAFTANDPTDKAAYLAKYTRLLADPTVNNYTIVWKDTIIGSIAKFILFNEAEVTYWLDKQYWGKGIGTKALKKFLQIENCRPIFGRVAFDNFGSQKILEHNGFLQVGKDKGFANARQIEVEEYIYKLV